MNQISLFIANNKRFFDPLNGKNYKYTNHNLIMCMDLKEFINNYDSKYFHEDLSEIIINPDKFIKFLDTIIQIINNNSINEITSNELEYRKGEICDLHYKQEQINFDAYEFSIYDDYASKNFQIIFIPNNSRINIELKINLEKIKNEYLQINNRLLSKLYLKLKINIPRYRINFGIFINGIKLTRFGKFYKLNLNHIPSNYQELDFSNLFKYNNQNIFKYLITLFINDKYSGELEKLLKFDLNEFLNNQQLKYTLIYPEELLLSYDDEPVTDLPIGTDYRSIRSSLSNEITNRIRNYCKYLKNNNYKFEGSFYCGKLYILHSYENILIYNDIKPSLINGSFTISNESSMMYWYSNKRMKIKSFMDHNGKIKAFMYIDRRLIKY